MKLISIIQNFIIVILFALIAGACNNGSRNSIEIPNVIIIYTDDQGTIDANCYGATDLYTPNIDLLAQNGIKFTQFYAAACICSPSRAALLTGKTPYYAGLPSNASSQYGDAGMPTEQITIAEKLKAKGYVTGHIGKWHVGFTEETMPNAQGFDYSFGHMGGCIDNYSHFFYWQGPNCHDLWENGQEVWEEGQYFQDLISEKAISFIQKNKEVPFFLYYAINMPHYPLQGSDKWREYYKNLDSPREKYAACVSTVDERIGFLLDELESLGLKDNTIVIFQSDHGHSTEERTFGGGGNAGIYRGAKFSYFEGGIRIPAIISWPGKIPEQGVRDQMCVNVDWLPTILDLCNIEYQEDEFEGKSLRSVIMENGPSPHNVFWWWQNENYWAVRKGDWKLLKNPIDPTNKAPITAGDSMFLVNIQDHPDETINFAKDYPEKVKELQEEFNNWYNSKN